MIQIEIPKRASRCFKGGEPLIQGDSYYSVVILEEQYLYQRQDYCLACWEKAEPLKSMQGMTSSWKSVVPIKREDKADLPKQRDKRALYLLKEILTDQEAVSAKEEAFVLSLYLARRRLITFRQELIKGGFPFSLYEVVETEEMLCVQKIALSDLRIENVQQELSKKFNS